MEQTLLQLNQLSKSYGRLKAVDQLSITIKKGNWYNATKLDNNITSLTERIIDSGAPFVNIYPSLNRQENNTIDVNFIIKPGQKQFINKIIIHLE